MQVSLYVHTNKLNGKKYVGITSQKPHSRWREGRGYKKNNLFYRAILKYGWENFHHEVLNVFQTMQEASAAEKEYIALWKTNQAEYGYNLEAGGFDKGEIAESTREKLRIRGHRKHDKGSVERAAAAHRGMKHSEETKKHLSAIRKEMAKEPWYNSHVKKLCEITRKRVAEVDDAGNILEVYDGIQVAATKHGVSASGISRACSGSQKTAAGKKWMYIDEPKPWEGKQ